ncbi:hypothetical protein D3C75_971960 [compost metagenome]
MFGGQLQLLVSGEGGGDFVGPVAEFDQIAILVQGDVAFAYSQGIHSQLLTLS